MNKFNKLMSPL